MTEDQIKHMVDLFLMWKLPENFNPDNGISFSPIAGEGGPHPFRREPSGTNLFDATQATAMVRHMIEGLPPSSAGTGAAPNYPAGCGGQRLQCLRCGTVDAFGPVSEGK